MLINFGIEVIVFGSLIVLGCFASIVLVSRKENVSPNKFLALCLLAIAFWLIDAFLRVSGIYQQDPDYYFLPIFYSFAFGPLIYFYVKSLTDTSFNFSRKDLLHFLPVSIQAVLYIFLSLQTYTYKRWYWIEVHEPYTYRIEFDGTFISLAIYIYLSILLIRKFRKRLADNYSDIYRMQLNWLRGILILLLALCLAWFGEVILRDFYDNYFQFNYTPFILGVLSLVLAYGAISQPNLTTVTFAEEASTEDEGRITIDDKTSEIIRTEMIENQAYLDATLNLKSFAGQCRLPIRKVSNTINHGFNQSFHDFVNYHRVEAVKKKLETADLEVFTIQGIAMECGFNSKATFNRIFKSFTEMTPSQYVRKSSS